MDMSAEHTLEENIERLHKARDEVKAVIREAHTTIKLANAATAELRVEHERWAAGIKHEVDAAISRQIKMGLDSFQNEIKDQTAAAHDRVMGEFDKLKNILLFGNEKGRGTSLVQDWVVKIVDETVRKYLK